MNLVQHLNIYTKYKYIYPLKYRKQYKTQIFIPVQVAASFLFAVSKVNSKLKSLEPEQDKCCVMIV